MKNIKGITLASLVVTVIILIIIAGITVNFSLDDNNFIKKAQETKRAVLIDAIEKDGNLIYLKSLRNNKIHGTKLATISEIAEELQTKGYDIEINYIFPDVVSSMTLDNSTLSIPANNSANLSAIFDGTSDDTSGCYAIVDNEYYKIELVDGKVTVSNTPTNISNSSGANSINATSSNSSVRVGEIKGNKIKLNAGASYGNSVITVTYGSFNATCNVTVVVKPEENATANDNISFSTNYGTIDVIWLSETTNNVVNTPNAPILASNGEEMSKVTWTFDSTSETWSEDETPKAQWYSYNALSTREANGATTDNNTSMWANAKTANGSYFVWIPRYAYRITYYDSETSTTPTGFYDGYGMWKAQDGTIKYELEAGVETVDYNGNKYIVHPAFNTDLDLGGWSEKLKGFWFAKYEMSGSTASAIKSLPNVESQRNQTIGTQYINARNACYGYTGTLDLFDSHTSYMHSHLVKNSEWGAVAYLTHSKYGRNGNEIDINNSTSYITGNGGGSPNASQTSGTKNAYNRILGTKASTTGNVYGIYDMNGGVWERAAAFDRLANLTDLTSTLSGQLMMNEITKVEENYISTKYATTYKNGTDTYGGNLIYTICKTGESTKEVYKSGNSAWFSDNCAFGRKSVPFFERGGGYSGVPWVGIFYSGNADGKSNNDGGFRTALCP